MELVTRSDASEAVPQAASTSSPKIRVRELPSKFLPYPEGVEIYYYPYSIGELEDCHQIFESEDSEKLASALRGVEVKGMPATKLDYQDLIYIMILRKLSTFNENLFNFNFKCPSCGKDVQTTQDISAIEFSDIPEALKYLPLKIKLKSGKSAGKELVLNTVTIEKFIEYNNMKLPLSDSSYIAMLVQNYSLAEAVEIVKSADGPDFEILMALREILDFDEQHITVTCPEEDCRKSGSVNVEVLSQLAVPFRRDAVSVLSEIYSGN